MQDVLEVDLKELQDSFDRIYAALNRRFEKDENLYVSKQQIEDIKRMIFRGQYQALYGKFKTNELSADILTRVIIKNSWLIHNINRRDMESYLFPIFNEATIVHLIAIFKEVIDNLIETPLEFKRMIEELYYEHIPINELKEALLNKRVSSTNALRSSFRRLIKSYKNPKNVCKYADYLLKNYPEFESSVRLMTGDIFSHLSSSAQQRLSVLIFEDHIKTAEILHPRWVEALIELRKHSYPMIIDYIERTPDSVFDRRNESSDKTKIFSFLKQIIIRTINFDNEEIDFYLKPLENLYKVKWFIRYYVLRAVKRILKQEIRIRLISSFESIGIPKGCENIVNDIKNGVNEEFQCASAETLFEEINKSNSMDFWRYVCRVFIKCQCHQKILTDFINEYGDHETVRDFLALYSSIIYDNRNDSIEKIIDLADRLGDQDFIDALIEVIEKKRFETSKKVKKFIHRYDFDLYKKLYGHGG